MIFHNIRPVEVNNGRYAAIFNFIDLKFFKMHPLLKPHNLFYSNQCTILRRVRVACRGFEGVEHSDYSHQCGL